MIIIRVFLRRLFSLWSIWFIFVGFVLLMKCIFIGGLLRLRVLVINWGFKVELLILIDRMFVNFGVLEGLIFLLWIFFVKVFICFRVWIIFCLILGVGVIFGFFS